MMSLLRDFDGKAFEARDWTGPCACNGCFLEALATARCRDCNVAPGQLHLEGCCVAMCRRCKDQALCCACDEWPPVVWTGTPYSPEVMKIAHRNGWFSGRVETPDAPNGKWMWQDVEPGTPDSIPNLSRISEYQIALKSHMYRCVLASLYLVKIRKWTKRRKFAETHYAPDGPGHLKEDVPAFRASPFAT